MLMVLQKVPGTLFRTVASSLEIHKAVVQKRSNRFSRGDVIRAERAKKHRRAAKDTVC